ncbi:MAG TPA: hypothetical protein VH593_20985 [Ktedonobacteraceae bacterium]
MQKFEIDLETILSLLEETHQSGTLFTNAPPGLLGQKTGCQVRIDLVEGKVAYCHIEDSVGKIHILSNNKSFRLLYDMGPLEWYVDTHLPDAPTFKNTYSSSPHTMLPANTGSLSGIPSRPTGPLRKTSSIIPRQLANVEFQILHRLSRNQRRVLMLVDGTINIEKIASMLHSSSQSNTQAVLNTLRELESLGLITIGG